MGSLRLSKKRHALARGLIARQGNAETRQSLSKEERDLLLQAFYSVDLVHGAATEKLARSRKGSATTRWLEAQVSELSPLWEQLRRVLEEDQPPCGYMQGHGAS